uniref:Uncharacterized protein n=1 Tax=Chloropicon laureae TaxID=464258 RepID=A0A7S3E3Q7_9CHLO|mmetsp:Transcript_3493/g.8775  ORF Transcript_3493/g.8775 Transcript_3493/m.8775 type:complete len:101 (+) Transcript_3493:492-794(+)
MLDRLLVSPSMRLLPASAIVLVKSLTPDANESFPVRPKPSQRKNERKKKPAAPQQFAQSEDIASVIQSHHRKSVGREGKKKERMKGFLRLFLRLTQVVGE